MTTDALNRTENPIQSPWNTPSGWNPFKLNGTGATAATATQDAVAYYTGSAQGRSEITIGTAGGQDGGAACHCDATGHNYVFTAFDGNLHIFRNDGTPNYFDLTSSVVVATYTPGDVWSIRRSGNFLIVAKNGVDQMTSNSDTTYTGGFDGIFNYDGTMVIDSWSNGAVTVTASQGRNLSQVGPGISPVKRSQFTPRQLSQQIVGANVTVALTGQFASFSQGTLAPSGGDARLGRSLQMGPGISPDYTKVFTARQLGFSTQGAPVTVALTGQSASFSQGTLSPATSVALTGTVATFSQGTLTASTNLALTGLSATFSPGSLTPSTNVALTGAQATFSAGTMTVGSDVTVALTGQAATFSAGLLTLSTATGLSGIGIAFSSGTLAPSTSTPLSGQQALFSQGTLTSSGGDVTVALSGITATFNLGSMIPSGGDVIAIAPPPSGGGAGFVRGGKKKKHGPVMREGQVFGEEYAISPFLDAKKADKVPDGSLAGDDSVAHAVRLLLAHLL